MNNHDILDESGRVIASIGRSELDTRPQVVYGEELFTFDNFQHWVNKASLLYSHYHANSCNSITLDTIGRICKSGKQFMLARDEDTFPVKVFRIPGTM